MSREQFWFFYPLRVRYSEVDCQGVVFRAQIRCTAQWRLRDKEWKFGTWVGLGLPWS